MKILFVIAVVVIAVVLFMAERQLPAPTTPSQTVTLRAAAGNNVVQMFDNIASDDPGTVNRFPDGTRCTKINGPFTSPLEGPPMRFYQVQCNGIIGFVNVKWVR